MYTHVNRYGKVCISIAVLGGPISTSGGMNGSSAHYEMITNVILKCQYNIITYVAICCYVHCYVCKGLQKHYGCCISTCEFK